MNEQASLSNATHLLSRDQAARALGISGRKLDYLREDRLIPFIRIGRRILYAPTDLEQFIETRRISG